MPTDLPLPAIPVTLRDTYSDIVGCQQTQPIRHEPDDVRVEVAYRIAQTKGDRVVSRSPMTAVGAMPAENRLEAGKGLLDHSPHVSHLGLRCFSILISHGCLAGLGAHICPWSELGDSLSLSQLFLECFKERLHVLLRKRVLLRNIPGLDFADVDVSAGMDQSPTGVDKEAGRVASQPHADDLHHAHVTPGRQRPQPGSNQGEESEEPERRDQPEHETESHTEPEDGLVHRIRSARIKYR